MCFDILVFSSVFFRCFSRCICVFHMGGAATVLQASLGVSCGRSRSSWKLLASRQNTLCTSMSNKLNVDAAAVQKAVQAEIERQQSEVVYKDLSVAELEGVVQHLTSRLELCKDALALKKDGAAKASACCAAPFPDPTSCSSAGGAGGAACCASGSCASTPSSAPALKATKVEGTWPDLPWTDRAPPPDRLYCARPAPAPVVG